MYSSKFQLILVSCLIVILAQKVESRQQLDRMVRYKTIEHPYSLLQIRDENGKFLCAGNLISYDFVLTAAECFENVDYTKVKVMAGAAQLTDFGSQRKIVDLIVHPDYVKETNYANIAVLKLNDPFVPSGLHIKSIEVCEKPLENVAGVSVYGWRHLSDKTEHPGNIYSTRLEINDHLECSKELNYGQDAKLFCVDGLNFDNQYSVSDLGGPAMSRGKIAGIAVSCTRCDQINYTTTFVDLGQFHDFIKDSMKTE